MPAADPPVPTMTKTISITKLITAAISTLPADSSGWDLCIVEGLNGNLTTEAIHKYIELSLKSGARMLHQGSIVANLKDSHITGSEDVSQAFIIERKGVENVLPHPNEATGFLEWNI